MYGRFPRSASAGLARLCNFCVIEFALFRRSFALANPGNCRVLVPLLLGRNGFITFRDYLPRSARECAHLDDEVKVVGNQNTNAQPGLGIRACGLYQALSIIPLQPEPLPRAFWAAVTLS